MKTLLLLSGGKDSRLVLKMLMVKKVDVVAVCISGYEKLEYIGARQAANKYGIKLHVIDTDWFPETTWNPLCLMYRNTRALPIIIQIAKREGCKAIASGVKMSDFDKMPWLPAFIFTLRIVIKLFGLTLINPLLGEGEDNEKEDGVST